MRSVSKKTKRATQTGGPPKKRIKKKTREQENEERRKAKQLSTSEAKDDKDADVNYTLTSLARSFLSTGYRIKWLESHLCYKSSLLRVLDVENAVRCDFQEAFLHLVNLRHLSINNNPLSITGNVSVLENLKTLIVDYLKSLAILEHLPQLRHLQFQNLEDKRSSYSLEIYPHENLQHLSQVPFDKLNCFLEKIPNLRKLVIDTEDSLSFYHSVVDLTCFKKLESLKFFSKSKSVFYPFIISPSIIFPQSLKRLKLYRCILHQTLAHVIGLLPELQDLKLRCCEFENSTWELCEGEFCQLQYLEISWSKLEKWLASQIHFPVLRSLILHGVPNISELPYDIGEIETLEMIDMNYCMASAFDSARTIHDEQLNFGNTLLQLRLGRTIEQPSD